MTSLQPPEHSGSAPDPGRGRSARGGAGSGGAGGAATGGATAAAGGAAAAGVAESDSSRRVLAALLVVLVAVGLVGATTKPGWNGPLAAQAADVGVGLEVALAGLLLATFRLAPGRTEVARQLRTALRYVLTGLIVAVAVLLLVRAHLHLPINHHRPLPRISPPVFHLRKVPHEQLPTWLAYLLPGLCTVAIALGALNLTLRIRRRTVLRIPTHSGVLEMDPEDLRDAVAEAEAILRDAGFDDARKAIIACYQAMERTLGDKYAADTPDELLARATAAGLVRGPAAGRLTSLFYEARFSTHFLGNDKRTAAQQAVEELLL